MQQILVYISADSFTAEIQFEAQFQCKRVYVAQNLIGIQASCKWWNIRPPSVLMSFISPLFWRRRMTLMECVIVYNSSTKTNHPPRTYNSMLSMSILEQEPLAVFIKFVLLYIYFFTLLYKNPMREWDLGVKYLGI